MNEIIKGIDESGRHYVCCPDVGDWRCLYAPNNTLSEEVASIAVLHGVRLRPCWRARRDEFGTIIVSGKQTGREVPLVEGPDLRSQMIELCVAERNAYSEENK